MGYSVATQLKIWAWVILVLGILGGLIYAYGVSASIYGGVNWIGFFFYLIGTTASVYAVHLVLHGLGEIVENSRS